VSAVNTVVRDMLAVWPLMLVIAIRGGVSLLCRAHTLASRLARTDWGWRGILRRERRLARRRELRLLHRAQKKSSDTQLAGSDPLMAPETHHAFRQLGKVAFDADLIGAWEETRRPYVCEVVNGQYRFPRLQHRGVRLPG
jgi:hypothetical protein